MGKCFPLSGFMFLLSIVPNGQSLVCFDRPMACLLKQTPSAVPTASLRTSIGGGIGWNDVSTNCLMPIGAGCWMLQLSQNSLANEIKYRHERSTSAMIVSICFLYPFSMSVTSISRFDRLLLVDLVGSRFPRYPRCHCCWYTTTNLHVVNLSGGIPMLT